ncbi:hypothetical protein AWC23_04130 [Mycobacterium saskatchewanense]|uniref:Uncharacterized protein n=1 Tax=Mycobacterium saskatchewanense TaxID=220927 RepID=A0AAJ3NT74_9MYCO|nr:hypothetical protein [Mycobacterium saskatchewanense]ORW74756.1 hypothetical protein AWC23_04130 [Mycobacterium saskatchewanense]
MTVEKPRRRDDVTARANRRDASGSGAMVAQPVHHLRIDDRDGTAHRAHVDPSGHHEGVGRPVQLAESLVDGQPQP